MHSLMKSGIRILEFKDSTLLQKKFKKQTLITREFLLTKAISEFLRCNESPCNQFRTKALFNNNLNFEVQNFTRS